MGWLRKNLLTVSLFDDAAKIHDCQPVTDLTNHRQIVADDQIPEIMLLLNIHHQIQNLPLHGNIQACRRFVGDNQRRIQGKRPDDTDSASLSAGQFVWATRQNFAGRLTISHRRLASCPYDSVFTPYVLNGSINLCSVVLRGLREPTGS